MEIDSKKTEKKNSAAAELIVVWTTVSTLSQAETIAAGLLNSSDEVGDDVGDGTLQTGLAACVQIDPPMTSWYRWDNALQKSTERRVVIKSTVDRQDELMRWLCQHHPYDEPQIVVLPVIDAAVGYARWVRSSCAR